MARPRHYREQRHHHHTYVMYSSFVKKYYVVHTQRHQTWPKNVPQQQQKLGKTKARVFVLGRKQKMALRGLASLLSICMSSQDSLAGRSTLT